MDSNFFDPGLQQLNGWHSAPQQQPHQQQQRQPDEGDKPKKKRNRKPVTCAQCRKRKLKCDRNDPCKPCLERGEGDTCDWSEAKRASPKPRASEGPSGFQGHSSADAADLRQQIDRLEDLLDNFQNEMYHAHSPPRDPLASLWTGNRDHHRSGTADALKLLAGAATQLGASADRPFDAYTPNIEYNTLDELIGALPFQTELDSMVQRFVDNELASFPVALASDLKERAAKLDRLSLDTDPCFVALLLAIALFETWYSTTDPKCRIRKDATIASYIKACRAALEMDQYLERPSLDALRALLILHRFHLFSERASNRFLLAQAFQLAQSLGMDSEGRPDVVAGVAQIDEQERRRLWSWMIFEDYCRWSDRHYSISPIHYNTELPSNATQGEAPTGFVGTIPSTTESPVQHLLFRSSIAGIARLITDRAYSLQSKPTWSQLCDVERDLRRIEASINATLQVSWAGTGIAVLPENASQLVIDRYIIMLELKQQYIRLFRPFLTRGLRHEALNVGRQMVVEAARYILAIHRAIAQDPKATRNWLLTHHVCNAMIVLAIEVFQDIKGPTAAGCQVDIVESIRLLETKPNLSTTTRNVISIVKRLMEGPKSDASRKRSRSLYGAGSSTNLSGDTSDLAFLLSGNTSSTFPFGAGVVGDGVHSFDGSTIHSNGSSSRSFDPNQPFTKALPIPMTSDPFVTGANLATMDMEADASLDTLWLNMLKNKTMYAVPDVYEWRELSKHGENVWRNGIDILS